MSFKRHIDETVSKCNQCIGALKQLSHFLHRNTLETIYKACIRPIAEYGDIIFHQPPSNSDIFSCNLSNKMEKIEQVQYRAALAVFGAWKGTCREKLYKELGWESLSQRRSVNRISYFHKIINKRAPGYLSNIVQFQSYGNIHKPALQILLPLKSRTIKFKESFFPNSIDSWLNNTSVCQKNMKHHLTIRKSILKNLRPIKPSNFGILDNNMSLFH